MARELKMYIGILWREYLENLFIAINIDVIKVISMRKHEK